MEERISYVMFMSLFCLPSEEEAVSLSLSNFRVQNFLILEAYFSRESLTLDFLSEGTSELTVDFKAYF